MTRGRHDDLPDGPPGPPPVLGVLDEAMRVYGQLMVEHLQQLGIDHSYAQSRLMGAVPGEGIRLTDLADRLGVTKQSCGQMVDELVAVDFLEKRPDPVDGRAKLIFFGPAGDRSLPRAWAALHQVEDAMAQRIGDDGVEQLRRLLVGLLRPAPEGSAGDA